MGLKQIFLASLFAAVTMAQEDPSVFQAYSPGAYPQGPVVFRGATPRLVPVKVGSLSHHHQNHYNGLPPKPLKAAASAPRPSHPFQFQPNYGHGHGHNRPIQAPLRAGPQHQYTLQNKEALREHLQRAQAQHVVPVQAQYHPHKFVPSTPVHEAALRPIQSLQIPQQRPNYQTNHFFTDETPAGTPVLRTGPNGAVVKRVRVTSSGHQPAYNYVAEPQQHVPAIAPVQYTQAVPAVATYRPPAVNNAIQQQPAYFVQGSPAPRPQGAPRVVPARRPQGSEEELEDEYPADPNPQYNFAFDVKDDELTNYQNRQEERDGGVIKGSYSVVDPDGYVRTVTYTADSKNGFQAKVTREPTDVKVKFPVPTETPENEVRVRPAVQPVRAQPQPQYYQPQPQGAQPQFSGNVYSGVQHVAQQPAYAQQPQYVARGRFPAPGTPVGGFAVRPQ